MSLILPAVVHKEGLVKRLIKAKQLQSLKFYTELFTWNHWFNIKITHKKNFSLDLTPLKFFGLWIVHTTHLPLNTTNTFLHCLVHSILVPLLKMWFLIQGCAPIKYTLHFAQFYLAVGEHDCLEEIKRAIKLGNIMRTFYQCANLNKWPFLVLNLVLCLAIIVFFYSLFSKSSSL